MAKQTEDDEYLVSSIVEEFASDDEAASEDVDELDTDQVVNSATIRDILEYCDSEIEKSNSLDVLNIPQNATPEEKIAVFDEIAIHKGVVMHLRNIKSIIKSKREN